MTNRFIVIAGNIGVGKSTLVQKLAEHNNWQPFYEEFEENPYLADFYDDMRRWSFHSQTYFLTRRLKQHHRLTQQAATVIQDRSVYEDANIFGRNLFEQGDMSETDWNTYYDLYETIVEILPAPQLVIYLQASTDTLLKRIAKRGRDYEQSIEASYLNQLNNLYERWVTDFKASPVLTLSLIHI